MTFDPHFRRPTLRGKALREVRELLKPYKMPKAGVCVKLGDGHTRRGIPTGVARSGPRRARRYMRGADRL